MNDFWKKEIDGEIISSGILVGFLNEKSAPIPPISDIISNVINRYGWSRQGYLLEYLIRVGKLTQLEADLLKEKIRSKEFNS